MNENELAKLIQERNEAQEEVFRCGEALDNAKEALEKAQQKIDEFRKGEGENQ